MSQYAPILKNDPTVAQLLAIFNSSVPGDWVHDDHDDTYALKAKPVVSVRPTMEGDYGLFYGYDEVASVDQKQKILHLG